MARFRLIPREEKFFADFITMADKIRQGAKLLEDMLAADRPTWDAAEDVKEVEHGCDQITQRILQRLHRTFVTPIDREDVYALAAGLDDVMDAIDRAATLVQLYRIEHIREGAREQARMIVRCTQQIHRAMSALESRDGVSDCVVEINRLEHDADGVHHRAVQALFAAETDPIQVIKWKDILEALESVSDRCEDIANLLEGVVVKHG